MGSMLRRSFLAGLVGLVVTLWFNFKWRDQGAVFQVVQVDPQGSGMDWSGHTGMYVTGARRCCKNCTMIFGWMGAYREEMVGFCHEELKPLNSEAQDIYKSIENTLRLQGYSLPGSGAEFNLAG